MSELNGKHILIVGASEGIGLETAKGFRLLPEVNKLKILCVS